VRLGKTEDAFSHTFFLYWTAASYITGQSTNIGDSKMMR
jgi:hypothetical protein